MALWRYGKYNASETISNFRDPYQDSSYQTTWHEPWGGTEATTWSIDPNTGFSISGPNGTTPPANTVMWTNGTELTIYSFIGMDGSEYIISITNWRCLYDTDYLKGTFIEEVIAEYGTYPDDGVSGSYWYVAVGPAAPNISNKIDGAWEPLTGHSDKIDGVWKSSNQVWDKISGIWTKI